MSRSISASSQMERQHGSLLANVEKQCLVWLAKRMPLWVGPDHLTLLALASMFMAGLSYARSPMVVASSPGGERLARRELVRRQPGWDTRPGSKAGTAPLRFLCRSHGRFLQCPFLNGRSGSVGLYDASGCRSPSHHPSAALDQPVPGGLFPGRLSAVVLDIRPHGTEDIARRGERRRLGSTHGERPWFLNNASLMQRDWLRVQLWP